MNRLLALSLLVLSAHFSPAQDVLPPPKSPVLARLPEFSSWTVTYRYREEAKSNASPTPTPKPNPYLFFERKQSVSVIRTGKVWSESTDWDSGTQTQLWIWNNLRAGIIPGTKKLAMIPFSNDSESFDYRRMDFEGLDWIKPENYRGPAKWKGQPVYFFEESSPAPSPAGKPLEIPTGKWGSVRWAVVSPETRLPLLSYDGEAEREYRYKPAPVGMQVPPDNFQKLFDKMTPKAP